MKLFKNNATSREHELSEPSARETEMFAKLEFITKELSEFSADGEKNLKESDINALQDTSARLKELKNTEFSFKNSHFVDILFFLFKERQKIEQVNYRRYLIVSIDISICYMLVSLILNNYNYFYAAAFQYCIVFATFLFWVYSLYLTTMKRTRVRRNNVFDTFGNCFYPLVSIICSLIGKYVRSNHALFPILLLTSSISWMASGYTIFWAWNIYIHDSNTKNILDVCRYLRFDK